MQTTFYLVGLLTNRPIRTFSHVSTNDILGLTGAQKVRSENAFLLLIDLVLNMIIFVFLYLCLILGSKTVVGRPQSIARV